MQGQQQELAGQKRVLGEAVDSALPPSPHSTCAAASLAVVAAHQQPSKKQRLLLHSAPEACELPPAHSALLILEDRHVFRASSSPYTIPRSVTTYLACLGVSAGPMEPPDRNLDFTGGPSFAYLVEESSTWSLPMSLSPASAAASSSASSARPKLLLATCTDGGPLVPVDGSVKVYTCGPPRLFLNGLPAPGSLLRAYTLYRTRSRTHMLMVMDFNTVIDNDSGNNEGGGVIPVAAATAAAPVASAAGQEQKQVQPEVDKAALQEQLRRPQPEEPVVSEEPRRQEDKAPDQGPAAMQ